jgi:hypothetical protein
MADLTQNQQIIFDVMTALAPPPPVLSNTYVVACSRAASELGRTISVPFTTDESKVSFPLGISADSTNPLGNVGSPRFTENHSDGDLYSRNVVMASRNNVFEVVDRVNSFVAKAKNAGYAPPENPFLILSTFSGVPDSARADQLVESIRTYLRLIEAETKGTLDLEKQNRGIAQLSSAAISFEGLGGSGNAAADLMKFLPDLDALREQRAENALSALDFKSRVPSVLFTADYSPDGHPAGSIIGWKKMPDASGYIVKRRNIFDGKEAVFELPNSLAQTSYSRVREYVKTWILDFYDNLPDNQVLAFLDETVPDHGYFLYRLQAYQVFNSVHETFRVATDTATLPRPQRSLVAEDMSALGKDVSPYPLLARRLLGDDQLDWVLAAVNTRASINRGDDRSVTRKYSYLHAQLDFLYSQMDQGLFVVPKNSADIFRNISDGISKFGVTQMILEVLQDTGCLFEYDVGGEDDNQMVVTVLSSIDPETATIDLKALAQNMPRLLSRSDVPSIHSNTKPSEISVTVNETDDVISEDELQFVQKMGNLQISDSATDLTTSEGLGKMVRIIRVFSDSGPGSIPPISSKEIRTETMPTDVPKDDATKGIVKAETIVAQYTESRKANQAIENSEKNSKDREKAEAQKEKAKTKTGGRN